MHIDLKEKMALVTASTAGIGLAIAHGLAAAGATTIINGRSREGVDAAVAKLRAALPEAQVRGLAADVSSAAGCDTLARAVPDVDILVNNAGIFGPQDFFEIPDERWQHFYDVNVMSGVRLSRAYLPGMAARGWGRVVFIASESALNIPDDMIHYGMTKTAQLAISRGLAKRMRGTGVTVNAVLPGPTLSDGMAAMLHASGVPDDADMEQAAATFVREHRPSSLIGRAASTEEVANMVIYVASPQASATTGAALRVDGGVVDSL
ncbi:SDR family oxidoreductase [Pandoraea nosoerga]|uniref:Oxidoreductase n=1 Tax=Pandoraea nosoerga TaxID=2508296 RepID=A0A5E4SF23_9BURK|nr:SDR family oxidoreductase [Pandoraea nosoerga]MBN4666986.1 SDR family oxidoreductase [Pandoraea nosoerga]MBN4674799.1 SDR family oxidoreductase [Pandoraea nosoerga]MBN4681777.1 SDR family oxidoreductase [Pandoraea nosoerga]MBN4744094.1 SDR family oxidoreductase [Pandoraea nosoerga]VVD73084.1 oxidoreductase [Pandoraea nosoerga]